MWITITFIYHTYLLGYNIFSFYKLIENFVATFVGFFLFVTFSCSCFFVYFMFVINLVFATFVGFSFLWRSRVLASPPRRWQPPTWAMSALAPSNARLYFSPTERISYNAKLYFSSVSRAFLCKIVFFFRPMRFLLMQNCTFPQPKGIFLSDCIFPPTEKDFL